MLARADDAPPMTDDMVWFSLMPAAQLAESSADQTSKILSEYPHLSTSALAATNLFQDSILQ